MTPYSTFIAKSRYSRYLNDKNRREHWNETVSRYFTFMFEHLEDKYNYTAYRGFTHRIDQCSTEP
jgi:ribonucleoside-triphosphate reductase (thioredoxin)